jgi:hypothetical protein
LRRRRTLSHRARRLRRREISHPGCFRGAHSGRRALIRLSRRAAC